MASMLSIVLVMCTSGIVLLGECLKGNQQPAKIVDAERLNATDVFNKMNLKSISRKPVNEAYAQLALDTVCTKLFKARCSENNTFCNRAVLRKSKVTDNWYCAPYDTTVIPLNSNCVDDCGNLIPCSGSETQYAVNGIDAIVKTLVGLYCNEPQGDANAICMEELKSSGPAVARKETNRGVVDWYCIATSKLNFDLAGICFGSCLDNRTCPGGVASFAGLQKAHRVTKVALTINACSRFLGTFCKSTESAFPKCQTRTKLLDGSKLIVEIRKMESKYSFNVDGCFIWTLRPDTKYRKSTIMVEYGKKKGSFSSYGENGSYEVTVTKNSEKVVISVAHGNTKSLTTSTIPNSKECDASGYIAVDPLPFGSSVILHLPE